MGFVASAMTEFDLPYVNAQRGRDGRVLYFYFRRNGRRWRLPGPPLSEEFMAEYRRLRAATESAQGATLASVLPGSFAALIQDYFASPEFRSTKPNTQRIYRLIIEPLAETH